MPRLTFNVVLGAALVATAAALPACSKDDDGNLQVQVPDIDVKVSRDTVTVPLPNLPDVDVGTKRDTITTPTVGTKRTEVRRPTVDVKPP